MESNFLKHLKQYSTKTVLERAKNIKDKSNFDDIYTKSKKLIELRKINVDKIPKCKVCHFRNFVVLLVAQDLTSKKKEFMVMMIFVSLNKKKF